MIRLLLVDDHQIIRQGLEQLFATVAGVEVVGVASDGGEAVMKADRLTPDVVLMDVGMPKIDGVEATRQIAATHPGARIVMLSAYGDQDRIQAALQAGAAGYLLKHSDPEDVVRAVRLVHGGGTVQPPVG